VPAESEISFTVILRTLTAHGVEFIVVGGVSAVLQGAALVTSDLDIVHSRAPENIDRLLAALAELDACYRVQPERRIPPAASHLVTRGHQLLITRFGPLDLLGEIGTGHAYADLLNDAVDFEVEPGVRIHVLGLRRLIEVKKETAGEKDLAVLPLLERTLDESGRV
jgi:predicted nucleotidyltransferase